MVYERDFLGNEILIFDSESGKYRYDKDNFNKFYYPKKANGDQFYNEDIFPSYIEIKPNEFVYAVTSYNVQIYARDETDSEYYATMHGRPYFAQDLSTQNEFYPVDNLGDEFYFSSVIDDSVFAKTGNFFQKYARKKFLEFYPKLTDGTELYAKHNFDEYYIKRFFKEHYAQNSLGEFYFARDKLNDEIYALDSDLNEYQFNEQIFAKTASGDFKCIKTLMGEILKKPSMMNPVTIYKKNSEGHEVYEKNSEGLDIYKSDINNIPIYARMKSGEQIYPTNAQGKPFFLATNDFDIYAKYSNGDEKYFQGNNEKVFAREKKITLLFTQNYV